MVEKTHISALSDKLKTFVMGSKYVIDKEGYIYDPDYHDYPSIEQLEDDLAYLFIQIF